MRPVFYYNDLFSALIHSTREHIRRNAIDVHPPNWQGIDVSKNPAAEMREVLFLNLAAPMVEDLAELRREIKPNLPWADDHFEERVSGEPLNPGEQWKHWPWANAADKHRTEGEQFTHTYMERYWPRFAGVTPGGGVDLDDPSLEFGGERLTIHSRHGIRYEYGDLAGVVRLLQADPLTRQAYLPVWFPEDTGDTQSGRKPCSLGYHFILRASQLHVDYSIRSCDFKRHFRDDVYMTVRLVLWMLDELRKKDGLWHRVTPGLFNMHIGSLHLFINDYRELFGT